MDAKEAYEKFKHLDDVLSGEPDPAESLEWHIIYDLWDAVKTEALKEAEK